MEVCAIISSPKWVNVTLCLSHMNISRFLNDFSGWILDRFHKEFLLNIIYFLGGLYSSFSVTRKILCYNNNSIVCVTQGSVCYVINWHMIGCREVYIATAQIVHVLLIISITPIPYHWVTGLLEINISY